MTRRDPKFLDEKYLGAEPAWDTATALQWGKEDFEHHLRKSLNYYNYFFTVKELKQDVIVWLRSNQLFSKETLSAYNATPDSMTPMTVCGLIKATQMGMPLRECDKEYIIQTITSIVETKRKDKNEEQKQTVTIHDRVVEKTDECISDIDGFIDELLFNKAKPADFNVLSFLQGNSVHPNQVPRMREIFSRQYAELKASQTHTDDQLVEGYAYLSKSDYKRVCAFYDTLLASLDTYIEVKKVERSLSKKPLSKAEMAAKVKYLKESPDLGVKSINPVEIIGAKEVWLYDTKVRKLYRYVADSHIGALGLEGSKIVGFDQANSVGKMLRKPKDQLQEVIKCGKTALKSYLDNLSGVAISGDGVINVGCVILISK